MRRLVLVWTSASILAISAHAQTVDPGSPEGRLQAYWTAFSSGDYATAAQFMHPDDIAGLKSEVLPILTDAARSSNAEVKRIVNAFFEGVPEPQRAKLSGVEVFVQLSRFVGIASPDFVEFIKKSRMQRVSVSIDAADSSKALVSYTLQVADVSRPATQLMKRVDGVWFLRANDKPADVAARFKALLQK